jgi:hypothetical protein
MKERFGKVTAKSPGGLCLFLEHFLVFSSTYRKKMKKLSLGGQSF